MTIVPTADLGELGPREGQPGVFAWRWRYHLPSLAFWGLVALPLVLLKANRRWAAWAVLIPLGVVLVAFPMISRLFALGPTNHQFLHAFITSLAAGMTILALLAHWLARRRGLLAFVLAIGILVLAGVLWSICNYGLAGTDTFVAMLLYFGVASFTLLVSLVLAARIHRKAGLSARLVAWLLPWTILLACLGMLALVVALQLLQAGPRIDANALLIVLSVSSVGGTVLYLLSLPFLLLALRSRLYGQRFCTVLGLRPTRSAPLNEEEVQTPEETVSVT